MDCSDFSGNTPLHLASGLGRSAIASLLIAGGADVQAVNQEGEFPLDHARCRNHDDIIHLLEEAIEKGSGTDPGGEYVEECLLGDSRPEVLALYPSLVGFLG